MSSLAMQPSLQSAQRRTWPIYLGTLAVLGVLTAIPATRHAMLACDRWIAYRMNGMLGHNRRIDIFLAWLNDRKGDKTVILSLGVVFLIHSLVPWERGSVCRKLAFWAWVAVVFGVVYQVQEFLEATVRRDSPGAVLPGWLNLSKAYGVRTRVENHSCFPSGHAMAYFFFTLMALRRYRRMGVFLLAVSVIVPLTRMAIGGHWATDTFVIVLPLAGLWAALAWETPVVRLRGWAERSVRVCWEVAFPSGPAPLGERMKAAWREELANDR